MDVRGGEIHTTVSVGVASYPSDGGSLEVIIDKADKAMYPRQTAGAQQGRGVRRRLIASAVCRKDLRYRCTRRFRNQKARPANATPVIPISGR